MINWAKERPDDIKAKWILFLISPFFAFIYALQRMNTKSSFVIFFLFAVFFGLSFTVTNERTPGSPDGVTFRAEFEEYVITSEVEFIDGFQNFLSFKDGKKDYYFDTVAFGVSRITGNYHIMFMVFAMIFAFFQLKAFKIFISNPNFRNTFFCLLLAFLFTYIQIFNINGMRFWTAAWIGVYCIFQIFLYNNKRYFLLALCTPFFHGTFWIYILVIILAYFLKRFEKIWIVLFFTSFLVSSLTVDFIISNSSFVPQFLQNTISFYTSQERIMQVNAAGSGLWILDRIFKFITNLYINLTLFLFIKNRKHILVKSQKNLFQFLLVWLTFVNMAMPVPSLGNRYMLLSYPIIAYLWLSIFGEKKYRKWIYLLPFVFFMNIYHLMQLYSLVLDMTFYFSSPLFLLPKYLLTTFV